MTAGRELSVEISLHAFCHQVLVISQQMLGHRESSIQPGEYLATVQSSTWQVQRHNDVQQVNRTYLLRGLPHCTAASRKTRLQ